jgi:hypothetical protein
MASFHDNHSFLKKADVNKFYLGMNNLPKIPKSTADRLYAIESRYENRPDLLAHELYGTVKLWWVFALRNPDVIIDPLTDFASGTKIYIPPRETIDRVL